MKTSCQFFKRNYRIIFLLFLLSPVNFFNVPLSKAYPKIHTQKTKSNFRVVGYYSLKSAMETDLKAFPFELLTHINLYFLNPDTLGNFNQDLSRLAPFIEAAHKNHVKVIPSIAGGSQHPYYHALLRDDKRAKFINDLLQIVLNYNFDGIDVDIEGSDIDENYESFAVDLTRVFHDHNKLVTAAIAVFYKDVLAIELCSNMIL